MRELTQSPVVLILIEDETALYQIGEKRIFEIAIDQAKNSEFQPEIKVVCPKYIYQKNTYLSKITIEVMIYEQIDNLLELIESTKNIVFNQCCAIVGFQRPHDSRWWFLVDHVRFTTR